MAGAVYWIGQDGNVYYKGSQGVQNYGSAKNYVITDQGLSTAGANVAGNQMAQGVADGAGILLGTQIADPNVPKTTAPTSTGKVLNTGAVANTQAAIDQIAPLLQAALASEDQNYSNTTAGYDAQEAAQRGTYGTSSDTNQQNYDANFMDSIRAGIKGLGGLMNILRGTGAAGGTADDQVRDIVGGTTANDIRGGADTRDQNQAALDSSLATFLTDLKGKRQTAADTHVNNARAITRDSNTQLQDLYSKMAGYYGDAGQTGTADTFMAKAGALTPQIAADTRTQTSAYDQTPVVVHAPNLTAFAAPSQPDMASVPQDGQVGSGIFTISKKKDNSTTPVVAPQGA